jgi:beta-amylase
LQGDVWWGLTEASPRQYNFGGYLKLVELIKGCGLQFIPVMSFHECGGNVGDACNIPLPPFVIAVGESNNNIFYHDRDGITTKEYISLFADNEALFAGRTPLSMYGDFMSAFATTFSSYLGTCCIYILPLLIALV